MSGFLTREQSNYGGEPVLLYEFRRGEMRSYYASSDRDIETSVGTFTACAIKHSGLTYKGTPTTDTFEITVPVNVVPVSWFAYSPPSDTVYVVVRRFHWGQPVSAIVYIGLIVSVAIQPNDSATIKCQPVSITLKRGGLRMAWTRGCQHALYDQNCTVDREIYGRNCHVNSVLSNHFTTIETIPLDYFWPGGIVRWQVAPGTFEQRLIEGIDAHEVYPYGQMDGYHSGMVVRLYPGCKRTSRWCDQFYDNMSNFGGYQYMPTRTPYDGDSVF